MALLLVGLIVSLACSISCGGSGALAVIVAVGETALEIWLLIKEIKNINRKKIKEPEKVLPAG